VPVAIIGLESIDQTSRPRERSPGKAGRAIGRVNRAARGPTGRLMADGRKGSGMREEPSCAMQHGAMRMARHTKGHAAVFRYFLITGIERAEQGAWWTDGRT